tara:strand:+ start:292 stop:465 length:174 start_codon:yes stop_codon:yes gene_type:complete
MINIQNAQYQNDEEGTKLNIKTTIDGTEWSVPLDTANRHYQAILEWVAEGNTIEEAD